MHKQTKQAHKWHGAAFSGIVGILLTLFIVPPAVLSQVTMNIEIDYMVKRDSLGNILHSHRPTEAEVSAIVQMFGCQGITLNIVVDDEIPEIEVLKRDPETKEFFSYNGTDSFGALKATYYDHHWPQIGWHYCIFAHAYENMNLQPTSSSGLGEFLGDDFIVTLGYWSGNTGTPFEKAATLAHEFGHNLGLSHCGTMDCDEVGHNPVNVASIMSYQYQVTGVRTNLECFGLAPEYVNLFKDIDYSHGRMCTLDESQLNERYGAGMVKLDWNCNGVIQNGAVAQGLQIDRNYGSHWCYYADPYQVLYDYNEWDNILDMTKSATREELDNREEVSCITYEEYLNYVTERGPCPQPTLVTEPCNSGDMYYVMPFDIFWGSGTCSDPFTGLLEAQANALPGSILYLGYFYYVEPTTKIVLNKPMVITATDRAVIYPSLKNKQIKRKPTDTGEKQ